MALEGEWNQKLNWQSLDVKEKHEEYDFCFVFLGFIVWFLDASLK